MMLTLLYTVSKSSITFTSAIVPLVHPLSSISHFLPEHSKYNPCISLFSNDSQWILNGGKKIRKPECISVSYLFGWKMHSWFPPPSITHSGAPLKHSIILPLCIFPVGQGDCNHRVLGNMESNVHISSYKKHSFDNTGWGHDQPFHLP